MMLIWWKFIYFHYGAIGDNLFLSRFVRKFTCEPNINSAISAEAILVRVFAGNVVYNVWRWGSNTTCQSWEKSTAKIITRPFIDFGEKRKQFKPKQHNCSESIFRNLFISNTLHGFYWFEQNWENVFVSLHL